ncbi:MAG: NGG1p interacting factor NIF3 [Nitrospira bacterium HGW-Nitrospira-1]|nr:MAG: NGG1p interacting factor NIF3 [Nitrospira bacterium HGW-Nitrospira-1]
MKIREIYQKAVDVGVSNDPRGMEAVKKDLQRIEKEYIELKPGEKEFFDKESLQNPYADSRILNGSGEEDVKTILIGIDIEVGEILLCESLKKRGESVDLIVAHHPEGMAFANLYSVMHMQSDIMSRHGVPINIAEDLMEKRVREVERRLMPLNHMRVVDTARLLGIPFMCLHTPADNMVATFLQSSFEEKKPWLLSDVIDFLRTLPEYREAARNGSGPRILLGAGNRRAGRIFVDMTGGTEGSKEIFQSMATTGVNTLVVMHLSEEHMKEAEKNHLNVVVAGHIASDNLGLNLLLDEALKGTEIHTLACSGFQRVSRAN